MVQTRTDAVTGCHYYGRLIKTDSKSGNVKTEIPGLFGLGMDILVKVILS